MMIYAFFFRPLQAISRAFEYMRTELAAVRITSWYQLGRKIDYEQWYPFSFAHLTELNHLHRRARLRLTVPRVAREKLLLTASDDAVTVALIQWLPVG